MSDGSYQVDISPQLIADVLRDLESGSLQDVLDVVSGLHPADAARVVGVVPRDSAARMVAALPPDFAAGILAELDESYSAELLEDVSVDKLTRLLNHLDSDDAADVLGELDAAVIPRVLQALEDREAITGLLKHGPETAGGIMATEFVAVPESATVAEATEAVRRNAETVEEIFVVFVVDHAGRLTGFVSLKRLLLSPSNRRIGDMMQREVLSVTPEIDQEEVVRIIERYDLTSLAVVDRQRRLIGRITIDDAIDVIREEAEEDYQRLSGITGDEGPTDSVFRITRGRLPWLFLGMIGAAFAGSVIGWFDDNIRQASVLAAFIPVVMAMAGNAGIQSSAIIVQGLASGDVWSAHLMRRLGKEVAVAVLNGVALGVALALAVLLIMGGGWWAGDQAVAEPERLAATAGLSLFVVVLLAAGIGAAIPLLLDRADVDPALATGPFITTSNDIISLVVFFTLATQFYLPFV
ncbi:MAG: magnesium transporter [Bacteroidota bacterium]|nr:magnesium transporter [Bacteroidota bacterium]MDE2957907.1 magnesium transporter [Bacteroidota bacterium]